MSFQQQTVPTETLAPNPWNTNEMTAEAEAQLEESLKRFGFFRPVIVRETDAGLQILGGEHRWMVARKLGYPAVPVMNLGRISDAKAKEIGLVDNARYGADDTLKLAELLQDMGAVEDLQTFLPLSNDDLASIFSATTIALDDLDGLDTDNLPERPKASATHQIMRFKVPVEDVAWMQAFIERVMREQGFIGEDSMMNAGNALVFLTNKVKTGA